jgi:hypothetical protein
MTHAEAGGSLPVPNVQALAETYNRSDEQIPGRYIRDEEGAEEVIIDHDISSAIPIIDVNKLLDPQSSKEECGKLGSACKHWGFFQVYKAKLLQFHKSNIKVRPKFKRFNCNCSLESILFHREKM